MDTDIETIKRHFTGEELITLLECARMGIADADNFDDLADRLDISDEEMTKLRDKLHTFMQRIY